MNNYNLILKLTIEANSITKYYDGINFNNPTVTYDGFINGDTLLSLSGTLTYTGTYQTATRVGSYTIIPGGLTSNKYSIIFINGTLNIEPAILNIAINNYIKVYNGLTDIPNYVINYSGLIQNEDFSSFTGSITISGSCITAINTGIYTITPGGLYSPNYKIIFINSKLTIIPASLLIIANNVSKIYNGIQYFGGADVIYDGFMNDDTPSVLLGTLTYSGSSQGAIQIGKYVIMPGGLSSSNYNITFISGALDIYTNAFLIKASDFAKFYDSLFFSNPNLSYTGDIRDLSGTITFYGNYQTGIDVSSYIINTSGLYSNNYNITYYDGTLYINPNEVYIIANNYVKKYNAVPFDEISVTFNGLLGKDTSNNFSGSLLNVGTSLGATNIGTYNIIPSNLFSNNYSIIYQPGTLIINKSPLYIITQSFTKVYDGTSIIDTPYTIITSISGIFNNESITLISYYVSFRNQNAGSQFIDISFITLSGITLNNYYIAPVPPAIGYILQKPVIVTFSGGNKIFDNKTTVPKLLYSISGIIGIEQLSISSYFAKYRSPLPGPGIIDISYVILYGLTANNYYVAPVLPLSAFINSNNFVINWFGGSKVYDSYINPGKITFTISGLYSGDILTVSSYVAVFNTSNAGLNIITISSIILGGPSSISYIPPLSQKFYAYIYPAYLTLNFSGGTKVYDATRRTTPLIYTLSGTVASEIVTISSYLSLYKNSNAGAQIVDISFVVFYGPTGNNYTYYPLNSISATIYQKPITISFTGGNKIYDGTTFTSTVLGTLSGLMVAEYTYTNNLNAILMAPNYPVTVIGAYNTGPYYIDLSNNPQNVWYVYSNGITSNIYLDKSGNLIIDSNNFYNYKITDTLGPSSIYYALSISSIITKPYLYQSSPNFDSSAKWIWSSYNLPNQEYHTTYNNTTNDFIYGSIYINANATSTIYFNGNLIGTTNLLYVTAIFPILIYPGVNIIVIVATAYDQNPGLLLSIKNNITNTTLFNSNGLWVVSFNQPIIQYNYYSYAGILDQVLIFRFNSLYENPSAGLQLIDVSSIILYGNALNNYYLLSPPAFNATISKRNVIASFSGGSKTYDSTYVCGPINFSLSGLINVSIDNVFQSYYENITISTFIPIFKSNQVGLQLIDISNIVIIGPTVSNYNLLPTPPINGMINYKMLIASFSGGGKTYDSTNVCGPIISSLSGIIGQEIITISNFISAFKSPNAGPAIIDISYVIISGITSKNYLVSSVLPISSYIDYKQLIATFSGGQKTYDGTNIPGSIQRSLSGIIGQEIININFYTSRFKSNQAGYQLIDISNIILTGSTINNYTLLSVPPFASYIYYKNLIINFTGGSKIYDSYTTTGPLNTNIIGVVSPEIITISSYVATFRTNNVSTSIIDISNVIIQGPTINNYNLLPIISISANIYPRPLTTIFTGGYKIYDKKNTTGTISSFLINVVSGENIYVNSFYSKFQNILVGQQLIDISFITLSGSNLISNYYIISVPPFLSYIYAKDIYILFYNTTKTYNGTAFLPTNIYGTIYNIVDTDTVNLNFYTGFYRNYNSGYQIIDISNIYLTGPSTNNYNLLPIIPTSGYINPTFISAVFSGGTKIYDSTINVYSLSYSFTGVIGNDYITISSYTSSFVNSNAGNQFINISNIIIYNQYNNYILNPVPSLASYIYFKNLYATFTGGNKIYDKTLITGYLSGTLTGIVSNEIINIVSYNSTFLSYLAGIQRIDISNLILSGITLNNYKLQPVIPIYATIYLRPSLINFIYFTKTYNTNTNATPTYVISNIVATDNIIINFFTGTFNTPNTGLNNISIQNIYITNTDANNYQFTIQQTSSGYIYPKYISAIFNGGTKIYDATINVYSLNYILNGVFSTDFVTISSYIAFFKNQNVGNQFIDISNILIYNEYNNYALNPVPSLASYIYKKNLYPLFTGGDKTYDKTLIPGYINTTLSGIVNNEIINIISFSSTFTSYLVGIQQILLSNLTLSGFSLNNYNLQQVNSIYANIYQRTAYINFYSPGKIYDSTLNRGTVYTSLANTISSDLLPVTFGGSYISPNSGLNQININYALIYTPDADNYNFIVQQSLSSIIYPRPINALFSNGNKIYDGTVNVYTLSYTLTGILNNEYVTISSYIAFFSNTNVGNQFISISNTVIYNQYNNYVLNPIPPLPASINYKSLFALFFGGNKIYDKTYSTGSISGTLLGIVNNENINIISYTSFFNNYNVGVQRIDISYVTLSGLTVNNYSLKSINPIYAYIFNRTAYINFSGGNKIYDTTTFVTNIIASITNNIPSDNLPVATSATYTSPYVGINIININYAIVTTNDGLNYNFIIQQTMSGIISQRTIIASFIAGNKVYNRSTNVFSISGYLTGVIGSDNVSISNFISVYRNYTVGYNIIDVSNVLLGGLHGKNYIIGSNTVKPITSYIYKLPVNAYFTASDKIYDTTTNPYNLTYNLVPIYSNDDIYINSYNAFYTDPTIGYQNILITNVLLGGIDSYNYILLPVSSIYTNILPQQLTINFIGGDKVYDGTTSVANLKYTISGIYSTDTVNLFYRYLVAKFRKPFAGLQIIDVSNILLIGKDAYNYISNPILPFNSIIYQQPITIIFSNINKIYDRTQNIINSTISNQILGLIDTNTNVSVNSFTGLYKDYIVGQVLVDISNIILVGTDVNNYILQPTSSFTGYIYNRLLTINFFNGYKVYDSTLIPGPITYQISNIVSKDNIIIGSYDALFRDYNIGLQIIDVSNITLSGIMAFNYYLNDQPPFSANIYPQGVLVAFTGINKIYDNTTNAYVSNPKLYGLKVTDISYITVSSYISYYSNKFVQSNKTIYVTNIILKGTNSTNYIINPTTVTTYSDILPLQIYFISTGITKIYDQKTIAYLNNVYLSGVFLDDINYISISSYIANYYDINFEYNKLINITNILLNGPYAFNYYILSTITYGNILKKYLGTYFLGVNRDYNFLTNATVIYKSISGIIYPDIVSLSTYNSNFITPNVTINDLIIISDISFIGSSTNNYYTGLSYTSASITYPLSLNITLTANTILYQDISNYLSVFVNPLWIQVYTQISNLLIGINNNTIISYDGYIFNFTNNILTPLYSSNYNFTNLSMIDLSNGIICGLSGLIITTNNGFNNVNLINILSISDSLFGPQRNYTFNSVSLYNTGKAYIVGNNGIIFNSLDYGLTWIPIYINQSTNLNDVFILSDNYIYIVGNNGLLLTTTDGGNNWTTAIVSNNNLNSIFMIDIYNGYIVGNNGLILKTNNGGITWLTIAPLTGYNLNNVTVFNINNVYITGNNGIIIISTNRGLNWNIYVSGTYFNLTRVFVSSLTNMYIIGDQGMILTFNYVVEGLLQLYDNTTLLLQTTITPSNIDFHYYLNNLVVKTYSLNAKFYPTLTNVYGPASSDTLQINVKPIIYYKNPITITDYDRSYIIYSAYPFVDQSGGIFNILDITGYLVQQNYVSINSLTGVIQFNTNIDVANYRFTINYSLNNITNQTTYNLTVIGTMYYPINNTTLIYNNIGSSIRPYFNQLNGSFKISDYSGNAIKNNYVYIDTISGAITFNNNCYINNYTLLITYTLNNTIATTLYFLTIKPYINYSINFISLDYNTVGSSIKPIVQLPGGTFNIYDISNYIVANNLVSINTSSGFIYFTNSIPVGIYSFLILYTFNYITNSTVYSLNQSPYLAYPETYRVIQYDHTYYDGSSIPMYIPSGGLFTIIDISGKLINQNLVTINPYTGQLLFNNINVDSYIFMITYTYNSAIKSIYYTLQVKPSIYYIINRITTLYNNEISSSAPYINPLNGTFSITELDNVLVQLNFVNINYLTGIINFLQAINTGRYNFSIIYNVNNIINTTRYNLIVIPNIYYYNNSLTILYNTTGKSVNPNYSPLGGIFTISGFYNSSLISVSNTGVVSFNTGIDVNYYNFSIFYNSNSLLNYYDYNLTVLPIVRYDISAITIIYSTTKTNYSIIPFKIQPYGLFTISDNISNYIYITPTYISIDSSGIIYFDPYISIGLYNFTVFYTLNNITNYTNYRLNVLTSLSYSPNNVFLLYDRIGKYYTVPAYVDQVGGIFTITGLNNYTAIDISSGIITFLPNINIGYYILTIRYTLRASSNITNYYVTIQPNIYYTISSIITTYQTANTSLIPYYIQQGGLFTLNDLSNSTIVQNGYAVINQIGIILFNDIINVGVYNLLVSYSINNITNQTVYKYTVIPNIVYNIAQQSLYYDQSGVSITPSYSQLGGIFSIDDSRIYIDPLIGIIYFNNRINVDTYIYTITYSLNYTSNTTKYQLQVYPTIYYTDSNNTLLYDRNTSITSLSPIYNQKGGYFIIADNLGNLIQTNKVFIDISGGIITFNNRINVGIYSFIVTYTLNNLSNTTNYNLTVIPNIYYSIPLTTINYFIQDYSIIPYYNQPFGNFNIADIIGTAVLTNFVSINSTNGLLTFVKAVSVGYYKFLITYFLNGTFNTTTYELYVIPNINYPLNSKALNYGVTGYSVNPIVTQTKGTFQIYDLSNNAVQQNAVFVDLYTGIITFTDYINVGIYTLNIIYSLNNVSNNVDYYLYVYPTLYYNPNNQKILYNRSSIVTSYPAIYKQNNGQFTIFDISGTTLVYGGAITIDSSGFIYFATNINVGLYNFKISYLLNSLLVSTTYNLMIVPNLYYTNTFNTLLYNTPFYVNPPYYDQSGGVFTFSDISGSLISNNVISYDISGGLFYFIQPDVGLYNIQITYTLNLISNYINFIFYILPIIYYDVAYDTFSYTSMPSTDNNSLLPIVLQPGGTFSIQNNTSRIYIDISSGIITTPYNTYIGYYQLSILYSLNSVFNSTIYTVNILPSVSYTINTLTLPYQTGGQSEIALYDPSGGKFTIISNDLSSSYVAYDISYGLININPNNGIIYFSSSLFVGVYQLNIFYTFNNNFNNTYYTFIMQPLLKYVPNNQQVAYRDISYSLPPIVDPPGGIFDATVPLINLVYTGISIDPNTGIMRFGTINAGIWVITITYTINNASITFDYTLTIIADFYYTPPYSSIPVNTVTATKKPYTKIPNGLFSSNISITGLTINSVTGVLQFNNIITGVYYIPLTYTVFGTAIVINYTLVVTPILIYTPNILNVSYTFTGTSNLPYALPPGGIFSATYSNNKPLPPTISIDTISGLITTNDAINIGKYKLLVNYIINGAFINVPFTINIYPLFYYLLGNTKINYNTLGYSENPFTNPTGGLFSTKSKFYVDISTGIIKFNNQTNVGIYTIPISYSYLSLAVTQNYKLTVIPIYYYKQNYLEIIINNYGRSQLPVAKQAYGVFSYVSVSGTLRIPYNISYLTSDTYLKNGIVLNGYTGKLTFDNHILVGYYNLVLAYTLYNLVGTTTYSFIVRPYVSYYLSNILLDYNTSAITVAPFVDQSGGYFYFYDTKELNNQTNNIIINNLTGIINFNGGINVGLYSIRVAYVLSQIYNTALITLTIRPVYYYSVSSFSIIANTVNNYSGLPTVIQPGGTFYIVNMGGLTSDNVIIDYYSGIITFNNIFTGTYNFIFGYILNGSSITTTYSLTVLPFISYDINRTVILYGSSAASEVPYTPYPGGFFALANVTELGLMASKVSIDMSSGQIFFANFIDSGLYTISISYLYNNIINTFPYYLIIEPIFNYTISGVALNYEHEPYTSNNPNIFPLKGLFYFSDNSNNYPLTEIFLDRMAGTITVNNLAVGNYNIGIDYYLKYFMVSDKFIISILPSFYYPVNSSIIIYSPGYTYSIIPYVDPSGGLFTINYPVTSNLLYNLSINNINGQLRFSNLTPVNTYSFNIIYTYNYNVTFASYNLLIKPKYVYNETVNRIFYKSFSTSSIPNVNPTTGTFNINYVNVTTQTFVGIRNSISGIYINYYTGLINIPNTLNIGDYNINLSYTYNNIPNTINYLVQVLSDVYHDISSQTIVYGSLSYSDVPNNINGGKFSIDKGYNNLGIFIDVSSGMLTFKPIVYVNKYIINIAYSILDIQQTIYYNLYVIPYISYDISNIVIKYNTNYLSKYPLLNPKGGILTTNYGSVSVSGQLFITNFYPNHYAIGITYKFNNMYNTFVMKLIVNSIFNYSYYPNNTYGIVNYSNPAYVDPINGRFYLDISNIKILGDGTIIFDQTQFIGRYILNVYYKVNNSITPFYYNYSIIPAINYSVPNYSIVGGNYGTSVMPDVSPPGGIFNAPITIDSNGILYFTPNIIVGTYDLIINYGFNDISSNFIYNLVITPYIFYQDSTFNYGINSQSEQPINNCYGGTFSLTFDLHQIIQVNYFKIDISSGVIYFNKLINVNSYFFYVNYLVNGLEYTFTYNLTIIPVLTYLSYNVNHYSSLTANPIFVNPVGGSFSCNNLLDFIKLNSLTGQIIIEVAHIIGKFIFNIYYTYNGISCLTKLTINVLPNINYIPLIATYLINGYTVPPYVSISGGLYNLISVKTQSLNITNNTLSGLTLDSKTGIFYYNNPIDVDNYILTVNYFINDVSGITNARFIVESAFTYSLPTVLIYGTLGYSVLPDVNPVGGTYSLLNNYNNINIDSNTGIITFKSTVTVNFYNIIVNYLYNNVISTFSHSLTINVKVISVNFVANDKIYDGTTNVKFASNKLIGVINDDKTYIETYNANYQIPGPALNIPILVYDFILGGPDSFNYLLQYNNQAYGNIMLAAYSPNNFKINLGVPGNSLAPLVSPLFINPSFVLYNISVSGNLISMPGLSVDPYGVIQWDATVQLYTYTIAVLIYNSTTQIIINYELQVTSLLFEGNLGVSTPSIPNTAIESSVYQQRYSSTTGNAYVLDPQVQGLLGKFGITAYTKSDIINHNLGSDYPFSFNLSNADGSGNLFAYELNDDGTVNYSVGYEMSKDANNNWTAHLKYLSDFNIQDLKVKKNQDPIFDPSQGTYYTTVLYKVTIISLPDSIVYYTLDGTIPTFNSLVYNNKIELEFGNTVINAFAVTPGYANSKVITAIYNIIKAPCLLSKTLIRTPYGNELIDNLKEGDLIITSDNRIVPIIKINKYKIDNPDEESYPICIPKNYFDTNVPDRNTYISQGHAIHLQNNYWIYGRNHLNYFNKYKVAPLYYHILLPNYFTDNLIANNLIVESWSGNLSKNRFIKYQNKIILKVNNKEYIAYKKTIVTSYTFANA